MKLFIHLPTDIKHFDLLNNWYLLSTEKDREIADFFLKNFKWEIANEISPQYEINFIAIREIKKIIWKDSQTKRRTFIDFDVIYTLFEYWFHTF